MKSGIYKITSPSGRVYIGQSEDIKRRKNEYKNLYNKIQSQTKLYHSFLKYGWEAHIFEIIEYCGVEDLNCRERYWQDFYAVLNGGLNCILQECGEQRRVLSDEILQKKSERMKGESNPMYGVKRPKEWCENHSNFLKEMFANPEYIHLLKGSKMSDKQRQILLNSNLGRKASDETKQKMSNSHKGRIINEEGRKNIANGKIGEKNPMFNKVGKDNVNSKIIIDTSTGNIIYGISELSKLTGISRNMLKDQLNGYSINHTTFMFLNVVLDFENFFELGKYIALSDVFTEEEIFFINSSTLTDKKKKGMHFYKKFLKYGTHTFKNM